jgi:hypothetical protein
LIALVLLISSCGVKKEKITVGQAYSEAKTLSRTEIIRLFEDATIQYESMLIRKANLSFSAESKTQKKREKLPSVNGVLALKRDGDLRLQVFAPILKTTLADVAARDEHFEIWFPKKKTLYRGTIGDDLQKVPLTDADEKDEEKAPRENLAKLRPWHITSIFFHSLLGGDDSELFIVEEDSLQERYYVIHEIKRDENGITHLLQRIFLERATFHIRKKFLYDSDGAVVGEVLYWYPPAADPGQVPVEINLLRPQEGYRIQFRLDRIDTNPSLTEDMFQLTVPQSAKIVELSSNM